MSDLISRSALIKAMRETEEVFESVMRTPNWQTAFDVIENQPTAYDVEKVVAELEEEKTMAYDNWDGGSSYQAYSQAIDIVRKPLHTLL